MPSTDTEKALIRPLRPEEIGRALFAHFQRTQQVTRCWRRIDGAWVIRDVAFVDDWTEAEYEAVAARLSAILRAGGIVIGAFRNGQLKGFAAVEPELFGSRAQYLDLTLLHVSQDARLEGIGSALFRAAQSFAASRGAEKLYVSAHSAVESCAFYQTMGCVDAEEPSARHVEMEPSDRQLECPVASA